MPVTAFTELDSFTSTAAAQSYTANSISVVAGRLYLFTFASTVGTVDNVADEPTSVAVGAVSFPKIETLLIDIGGSATRLRLNIWGGIASGSATAGTIISGFPENQTSIIIKVDESTGGFHLTTPITANKVTATATSGVSAGVTLAAFGAGSLCFLVTSCWNDDTLLADSPMVDLGAALQSDSPDSTMATSQFVGQDLTPSMTIGSSRAWGAIGVEIAAEPIAAAAFRALQQSFGMVHPL